MPHISIKDVEAGMELSEDVTDRSGRVLMRAGATLSEKHIKVMKTWGVTHISSSGERYTQPLENKAWKNLRLEEPQIGFETKAILTPNDELEFAIYRCDPDDDAQQKNKQHRLASGMDGFLGKPVELSELTAKLSNWLESSESEHHLSLKMRSARHW